MIDVVFASFKPTVPPDSYWDMQMIKDLFSGEMWSWEKQYEFKIHYSFEEIEGDGAVVVIPARNQSDRVDDLNRAIEKLRWVVIMLTGDEESVFPFEKINHPNKRIWVMSPQPNRHKETRKLGSGYTSETRKWLKEQTGERSLDFFFAGQMNHKRRVQCADYLDSVPNGEVHRTPGFAQGLEPKEYYEKLSKARIAPCPSGGYTPDTFRLFEALEAGCIPIADEFCEAYQFDGYWTWFFDEIPPFPLLHTYPAIKEYIKESLEDYQTKANRVFAWWQGKKRAMAYQLRQDIRDVSGIDFDEPITVLIPTSIIPSHPSTEIIDQCIKDVRVKLPKAEIIIMIDGLNEHYQDRKEKYEEYIRRLLWKCNFEWHNVLPLIFEESTHQVGMTRKALEYVKTPTILFVEHDAPICSDIEFGYSWDELVKTILEGQANVIRFHHEAKILPDSKSLMLGEVEKVNGVPMLRTAEWSQRPHLARTQFYREMLQNNFSPNAYGMIEDHIYGQCLTACKDNLMGWYSWRLWIFHPEGDNIKRSYTLDGRKEDKKYDEDYKYD